MVILRNKQAVFLLLLLLIGGLISGCSSIMKKAPLEMAEFEPKANKSVIVFYRSNSIVGGAIIAYIFEVTDIDILPVAILERGGRYHHVTTPGEHTYMTASEIMYGGYAELSKYMKVKFAPGKTYHAVTMVHLGGQASSNPVKKVMTGSETIYHVPNFIIDATKYSLTEMGENEYLHFYRGHTRVEHTDKSLQLLRQKIGWLENRYEKRGLKMTPEVKKRAIIFFDSEYNKKERYEIGAKDYIQ